MPIIAEIKRLYILNAGGFVCLALNGEGYRFCFVKSPIKGKFVVEWRDRGFDLFSDLWEKTVLLCLCMLHSVLRCLDVL